MFDMLGKISSQKKKKYLIHRSLHEIPYVQYI